MRMHLVTARRKAAMTQEQVAESVGIERSFYARIELAQRSPSLAVAFALERLFRIPAMELLAESPEADVA